MKIVTNYSNGNESVNELTLSQEASSLVGQYKNIIREQDGKLQSLNEKFKELQLQNETLTVNVNSIIFRLCSHVLCSQAKLHETNFSMSQINDQNILLKAQLSAAGAGQSVVNHHTDASQLEKLQHQIQALTAENSHQKSKLAFYESELKSGSTEAIQLRTEHEELTAKIASMSKDQDDLLELLADQDLKMKNYRRQLRELGQQIEPSDDEN